MKYKCPDCKNELEYWKDNIFACDNCSELFDGDKLKGEVNEKEM